MKKTLAAIAIAGASLGAHAQFVANGDYVTDTLSGITWLNPDATAGRSFNDVALGLVPGGDLYGFRMPTRPEIIQLMTDGGFYIVSGNLTDTNPARIAANDNFLDAFDAPVISGQRVVYGLSSAVWWSAPLDPAEIAAHDYHMGSFGVAAPVDQQFVAFGWDDTIGQQSAKAYSNMGTWLISTAPIAAPVPEPSTYALLLIGLGAIGFYVRKRPPTASFA